MVQETLGTVRAVASGARPPTSEQLTRMLITSWSARPMRSVSIECTWCSTSWSPMRGRWHHATILEMNVESYRRKSARTKRSTETQELVTESK